MDAIDKGNARGSGYDRQANDFYQEPIQAIDMFLERETFFGEIWDPACGGGNIPRRCIERGYRAIGSDIVDRGYSIMEPTDFLKSAYAADNIITNPPYKLAEAFVLHGLTLATRKVAVIVRTAFAEGVGRHQRLYSQFPPRRIWQFSPRISMPPGGQDIPATGGSVAYCWMVWDKLDKTGSTEFGWLA